ncbi:hypothetical protein BU17DRAFT_36825 [Hysterangium stoloniferum]|nr:hypothetical protein BU17DRAFT_36825 [Hysterangium stoloniferum]
MAGNTSIPSLSSYATALVILPPPHIQQRINAFRTGNDKSFPRWTAHLTLLFPFVQPELLPRASSLIREDLSKENIPPFSIKLDKVSRFKQREYDTVYLGVSEDGNLRHVYDTLAKVFNYTGRPAVPHLTLGQAQHWDNSLTFLHEKGSMLIQDGIEWEMCSVVILRKSAADDGKMEIYDEIPFSLNAPPFLPVAITGLLPTAYHFQSSNWSPSKPLPQRPSGLHIATFNILHDPNHSLNDRFPRLLSTILGVQPIPDILCLQEVTDEALRRLLSVPIIQSTWRWCTHDPCNVLPDERNIVVLAREDFGFTWEPVKLRKHKPAALISLPNEDHSPLIIAVVHLTAGLQAIHHQTKLEELNSLIAVLQQRFHDSPWIMAGDFNLATSQSVPSAISDIFQDAWLHIHLFEDGGATYDPRANPLATLTMKKDSSPQRYDRIWVRHEKDLSVTSVDIFGKDDSGSDHNGVAAHISFGTAEIMTTDTSSVAPVTEQVALSNGDDEQLEQFIRREGGFPTISQSESRSNVVSALQKIFAIAPPTTKTGKEEDAGFTKLHSVVRFQFVPVGSYGLQVDTQDSDVDILVVGNISPKSFWSLARTRLRRSTSRLLTGNPSDKTDLPEVLLRRFIKDASVPMMELTIGTVHVDMQYCSAAKVLEVWGQLKVLPSNDSVFLLPASSLRTLNAYRVQLALLRVLPISSLAAFRLAYRALKIHCVSEGIFSSRLGYLGGIHLTLLLTRVVLQCSPGSSASQFIRAFFSTYAEWDWAQHAVTVPGLTNSTSYSRATGREPMVILSTEKPTQNVVQNANQHTLRVIVASFKRAHSELSAGRSWEDVCATGGICGYTFKRALQRHNCFIKIDLSIWNSSTVEARAWVSYVQSRLPHLLVLLQSSLPHCYARLWPNRFVDANDPGDLATGLRSFYFAGFDSLTSSNKSKVQAIVFAFEDELQRDQRYYDPSNMFVSVSLVDSTHLPSNITLPPEWVDGDIDPDDESPDDAEIDPLDDPDAEEAFTFLSSTQARKNRPPALRGSDTPHIPAAKLRTSSDIYNRIMWDRELNAEDYVIGYEDRFSGLMETPLLNWKRDVVDEEFVPFHRVMHFRRRSDGLLVWDRKNKIDLIFGSGIGQQAP